MFLALWFFLLGVTGFLQFTLFVVPALVVPLCIVGILAIVVLISLLDELQEEPPSHKVLWSAVATLFMVHGIMLLLVLGVFPTEYVFVAGVSSLLQVFWLGYVLWKFQKILPEKPTFLRVLKQAPFLVVFSLFPLIFEIFSWLRSPSGIETITTIRTLVKDFFTKPWNED